MSCIKDEVDKSLKDKVYKGRVYMKMANYYDKRLY